jgi:transcription-repair coupling factor (superfamily II helicase)
MKEEFLDRYGAIPKPLAHLFDIISLKCFLTALKIRKIEYSGKQISIHVTEHTPLDMQKILLRTSDSDIRLKLLPDGRIILRADKKAEELVHFIRNQLMDIMTL